MAALPRRRGGRRRLRQLFSRSRVIRQVSMGARGTSPGGSARVHQASQPGPQPRGTKMNEQKSGFIGKRTVWIGAGITAVAVVLVLQYVDFPPGGKDVDRYDRSGAAVPGDPGDRATSSSATCRAAAIRDQRRRRALRRVTRPATSGNASCNAGNTAMAGARGQPATRHAAGNGRRRGSVAPPATRQVMHAGNAGGAGDGRQLGNAGMPLATLATVAQRATRLATLATLAMRGGLATAGNSAMRRAAGNAGDSGNAGGAGNAAGHAAGNSAGDAAATAATPGNRWQRRQRWQRPAMQPASCNARERRRQRTGNSAANAGRRQRGDAQTR